MDLRQKMKGKLRPKWRKHGRNLALVKRNNISRKLVDDDIQFKQFSDFFPPKTTEETRLQAKLSFFL